MSDNAPEIKIARGVVEINTEGLDKAEEQLGRIVEMLKELKGEATIKVEGGERNALSAANGDEQSTLTAALASLEVGIAQLRISVEDLVSKMEEANAPNT